MSRAMGRVPVTGHEDERLEVPAERSAASGISVSPLIAASCSTPCVN
jgi:hypothetical protein